VPLVICLWAYKLCPLDASIPKANLPDTHPAVHEAFMAGKIVVQHGDKKFSLMALDQSQEHSIKFLKGGQWFKGLSWPAGGEGDKQALKTGSATDH